MPATPEVGTGRVPSTPEVGAGTLGEVVTNYRAEGGAHSCYPYGGERGRAMPTDLGWGKRIPSLVNC